MVTDTRGDRLSRIICLYILHSSRENRDMNNMYAETCFETEIFGNAIFIIIVVVDGG